MDNKSLLISIIIPVFNVLPYLNRCLISCISQGISDYEIICIDDGSTDESGELLDSYQKEYREIIKVVHIENKGVSHARNLGISISKGKYIWFIDPDDYIKEFTLKKIRGMLDNIDLVLVPYIVVDEAHKGNALIKEDYFDTNTFTDFKEFYKHNKFDKVWNYIVRRSVLINNDLYFGEGIVLSEDRVFDFFLKEHIDTFSCLDFVAYYYIIRQHSATKGHIHDDNYAIRMIENDISIIMYINNRLIHYSDDSFFNEAIIYQMGCVRTVINNTIKLGDVNYLKTVLDRLKKLGMYPYKTWLAPKSDKIINNIVSYLTNVPILAFILCRLYSIKRK